MNGNLWRLLHPVQARSARRWRRQSDRHIAAMKALGPPRHVTDPTDPAYILFYRGDTFMGRIKVRTRPAAASSSGRMYP